MANKRKNGKREANGRLSRKSDDRKIRDQAEVAANEWDTMGTALLARWRVHKVEPANLKDQMAGSAVGRYCLQERLTPAQYAAAIDYLEERDHYLRCISVATARQPGAVDLNATRGQSVGQENVTRTQTIVAARKASEDAIRDAQYEVANRGNLFGAIDAVLIRDVMLDHLLGDLRIALNALVRRYRLPETSTPLDVVKEPA